MKKTFETFSRNEADEWSTEGASITATVALSAIQSALKRGPIIVEHGYYRGGTAPSHHVFEEWPEFESYMDSEASAGDTIDVWPFAEVCQPKRRIATGKCPATDGKVPKGGAY